MSPSTMVSGSARDRRALISLVIVIAACGDQSATEARMAPPETARLSKEPSSSIPPQVLAMVKSELGPTSLPAWKFCLDHGTASMTGAPYVTGLNCRVVMIDDYPRRFVVHVPTRFASPPPLVFMFHGSNGSGEGRYQDSGWREKADAEGLIAVFGTGLSYKDTIDNSITTHWNSPDVVLQIDPKWRPPGYPKRSPIPANDLGFTDAMLSDVGAQLGIDVARVYAAGFSSGANFVAQLAVHRDAQFAAMGIIEGGNPLDFVYNPSYRVSFSMATGAMDPHMVDHVNADRAAAGQPPISSLPIDVNALLAYPYIQAIRDDFTGTLDLDPATYTVGGTAETSRATWITPLAGNTDGTEFNWGVMANKKHEWVPEMVDHFWSFFARHHK